MNTPIDDNKLRVAITGAGGYLGRNLCAYLREQGAAVFQLTSNPARTEQSMPAARFTFHSGVEPRFFSDHKIEALIHAAYDFHPRQRKAIRESNVKRSIDLFAQARTEGVKRIIFISSMSAYKGCRSLYGSAKLEIEKSLSEMHDGLSVRPGLIYSTPLTQSGGMIGSVLQSLERGLIPLVGKGDQILYLSHVQDLCRLVEHLILDSGSAGSAPVTAAHPQPYALREIIQLLALTMKSKKARLVPVPWRLAWAGVRVLEGAGVQTEFRSDSILSLVHQNPDPDFSAIPSQIAFRDFAAAIGAASS